MSQANIPLPGNLLDSQRAPRTVPPAFAFGAVTPGAPSLGDLFGAAFDDTITGTTGGAIGEAVVDRQFDPDYRITPAQLRQLGSGLDPDLIGEFADAQSDVDAQNIRRRMLEVMENRRTIASGGIMGAGVYAVTQLTDPATLALTFASGGLAQAGNATRLAKLGQAARLGLIEAGLQLPGELIRSEFNPNFDTGDVSSNTLSNFGSIFGLQVAGATRFARAVGGAVGAGGSTFVGQTVFANEDAETAGLQAIIAAGFGGVLGAIAPAGSLEERLNRDTTAYARELDQKLLTDTVAAAGGIVPSSRIPRSRRPYDTIFVDTDYTIVPDPPEFAAPDAPPPPGAAPRTTVPPAGGATTGGTVGASAGSPVPPAGGGAGGGGGGGGTATPATPATPPGRARPAKTYLDLDLTDVTDAKASVGIMGFRFGQLYRAARSQIPFIRSVANRLDRDLLRKSDGSDVLNSAMQWTQRAFTSRYVPFLRTMDASIKKAIAANPTLTPDQVRVMIADAAEGLRPTTPEIREAVVAVEALMRDNLDTMLRHGVKGAEQVQPDRFYMPHLANRQAIDKAYAADRDGLINMAVESLRAGYQKLTTKNGSAMPSDAKLRAYATAWAENAGRFRRPAELGRFGESVTDMVDEFTRRYQGTFGTLNQQDIDRLSDIFEAMKGDTDSARFVRLRNALPFDMTYADTLQDGSNWKMTDFFERRVDVLVRHATRKSMGHSAMAALTESLGDPTIASPRDILAKASDELEAFRRAANADGIHKYRFALRREENNLKRLDNMMRAVLEAPVSEETTIKNLGSIVRASNFARLLAGPSSAINNAAEPLAAMAQVGFRASLKVGGRRLEQAFNGWFSSAKSGTINDKVLREIENLGIALDFAAGRVLDTTAEADVPLADTRRLFARGQRGAYRWSGQQLVEEGGRKFVSLSIIQRLSDDADGSISDTRLRSLGLTRPQWDRIADQIRKHRTLEDGPLGQPTVTAMNFASWDAGYTADARRLNDLISKKAGELILQPSGGQMDLWMTSEGGKIVMQLRSYMIASQDRFLRGVQDIRDPRQGLTGLVMAGTFSAGLMYAARTYINSLSQEDPQEYRDKNLAFDNVALQAFGRASYSNIIPFLVDTTMQLHKQSPVFAPARTSELGQQPGIAGAILSNPTTDLANTLSAGYVEAALAGVSDDQFTEQNANSVLRLIPNVFYIRDRFRTLTRDLPDRDTPPW